MVREDAASGEGSHPRCGRRRDQVCAGPLRQNVSQLDEQRARLVHLPPALVGPSDPRVVLRRLRPYDRLPHRRLRVRGVPLQEHPPRERRARHLVLQRALAVLHARLAGQDGGSGLLLPDGRARHGLRHHLLLGRAHDLLRLRAYEEDPVPHGAHPRPDPRPAGQENVQVRR